jgi:dipeptidyl-peptidase-4
VLDVASGLERPVFDPRSSRRRGGRGLADAAERARRERARERSTGVTEYATDRQVRRAVFAMSGRLFWPSSRRRPRAAPVPGPADDPHLDPTGERISYVIDGALHVREIQGGQAVLASEDEPDVTWGLAEFAAAEEMNRRRGHWWSPDGSMLAAARVDERAVKTWYIADQTDPAAPPRAVRYPQAGTEDAVVTLHLFDVASGARTEVSWDAEAFPYLGRFHWSEGGAPLLTVVARDQRRAQLLEVDPATGATTLVREETDPEWVELVLETPLRLSDGPVVTVVADRETDTYRLEVDRAFVTPDGLQVRGVPHVGDEVLFRASDEPTEIHLWRLVPGADPLRLTEAPGVHSGTTGGGTSVVVSATLEDRCRPRGWSARISRRSQRLASPRPP